MKSSFYAVAIGRKPGIYHSWEECKRQVSHYKDAMHRRFDSEKEAEDWIAATQDAFAWNTAPVDTDFILYVFGVSLEKPKGAGGYGAILISTSDGDVEEFSKSIYPSTKLMTELSACIDMLGSVSEGSSVLVYSDSKMLVNSFRKGWIDSWKHNGWQTSKGEPVMFQELWFELIQLTSFREVHFSLLDLGLGNPHLNRCYVTANEACKKCEIVKK